MDILVKYLTVFAVGGVICAFGQILVDKTKLTPARILVGYLIFGMVLSAVGLYDKLVDFAGAGATVPLSGFGHLLAKGVREGVKNGGLVGILKGGLTETSAGIAAAIFFGFIFAMFLKPKEKNG